LTFQVASFIGVEPYARRPPDLAAMELGLATFADVGLSIDPQQRLRNLLEEVELADQLGLDVFGIGEHHRPDFAVSSPTTVLAAAAVNTERIRLASAVTVLSTADPVLVFEEFATVDLLSRGRAEIMAARRQPGDLVGTFPAPAARGRRLSAPGAGSIRCRCGWRWAVAELVRARRSASSHA
jgi:hypothetical protein